MYMLAVGKKITINSELADQFGISTKTLGRYLQDIKESYSDIICVKKEKTDSHARQPSVYQAINPREDLVETLKFFFENRTDLGWVLQLLHEKDPALAIDGEYEEELSKLISKESNIFVFKSTPFEILQHKHKKIFATLKLAVKYNEYKNILYCYNKKEEYLENVKCLKLMFIQNNWYLAIEDQDDFFRLLRISFIQELARSDKSNYRAGVLVKYEKHFENIQNAMTLYGEPIKKATCKASAKIAIYFQKDMKPFLSSQRYIRTCDDGSIDFELSYTQAIEILPFIKQWLPDIKILEPQSLVDILKKDILKASNDYIS